MRTFTDSVSLLRHGELADELTDQLSNLIASCKVTGRTGELILKLKIKPGKGGQVEVYDDVVTKAPKPERQTSIMFIADGDMSLQREDPRQRTLPNIRTVENERVAPIDVNAA